MTVLLALLLLSWCVWAAWPGRPANRPPCLPQARDGGLRPAHQQPALVGRRQRPSAVAQPLTEDDLIAFGLALESSHDVLGELGGRWSTPAAS